MFVNWCYNIELRSNLIGQDFERPMMSLADMDLTRHLVVTPGGEGHDVRTFASNSK